MNINIEGFDQEQVEDYLAKKIYETVHEEVDRRVDNLVRATVDSRIELLLTKAAAERIQAEVDTAFTAGWQKTNNYGEPNGSVLTLRDRVRGVLDQKDSYSSGTLLSKTIADATKGALDAMVKQEVEAARVKLREAFDAVIVSKFTETIRKALGVL